MGLRLFSIFKTAAKSRGTTSVAFELNGFALAHVVRHDNARPELTVCEHVSAESSKSAGAALAQVVRDHGLAGTRAVCVPDARAYTIHQLESPQVEPDELAEAVRWSLADQVEFDVSEAVVDAFELLGAETRGRPPQACAIAAPQESVRELVQIVRGSQLEL